MRTSTMLISCVGAVVAALAATTVACAGKEKAPPPDTVASTMTTTQLPLPAAAPAAPDTDMQAVLDQLAALHGKPI
jgi:hypothetical protein